MPTFKINKEEQDKVNYGKGREAIDTLLITKEEIKERNKKAENLGMKKNTQAKGFYSERDLRAAESHKNAIDRAEKDRAQKKQFEHEKSVGGAMTESFKQWKSID